jgi:hypothetical protein
MVTLRKLALSAFLTVSAFATVTMTSCKKDDEGCATGYEGSDCKTLSSTKFVGTYAVTEDCGGAYNMTITTASTTTSVVFSNLGNFAVATPAVVTAAANGNSVTFTNFIDAQGRKFTGSGTLSGSTLTVNYTVTFSDNTTETCTAVMVKQ